MNKRNIIAVCLLLGFATPSEARDIHYGAIADAADLPILRPLIAYDKTEAIDVARRIGTYDISIQPHPDCCTVFQPRSPSLKTTPAQARSARSARPAGCGGGAPRVK